MEARSLARAGRVGGLCLCTGLCQPERRRRGGAMDASPQFAGAVCGTFALAPVTSLMYATSFAM